ncbi:hypothetical protein [Streptomyces alanosinicus]|uniref:Uncharacterized protein n=1 Tax=Streptomyces alanosinicus TaxID=68171 RepID=A0A918YIR6_9ACTN|nr:hypothetical protein [Streptomyces alanosinicus]GHE03606.1 hypothetical protein GCM10010339_31600 [Streptomyces alanosinicus]
MVAACGAHGPGGGFVAVGAAGGPARSGTAKATPTGSVSLVPLDGGTEGSGAPSGSPGQAGSPADTPGPGRSSAPPAGAGADTGAPERTTPPSGPPSPSAGASGPTTPTTPATPTPTASGTPAPTPGRSTTPTPAALVWGRPTTKAVDQRWCQKVTVGFRNSGGTAVRSGSVTFGTHIIGALGIDWGTVDSAADLPVPITPGAHKSPTWTVCIDAWRVPLGMHIETRDVSVRWK